MFAQKRLLSSFWTYIRDGLSSSWAIVFSYCHLLFPFWMEVSVSVCLLRGLCSLPPLCFLSSLHLTSSWCVYFYLSCLGLLCWPSGGCDSISSISFRKFSDIDFSNIAFAPVSHLSPFETVNTLFVPSPLSF